MENRTGESGLVSGKVSDSGQTHQEQRQRVLRQRAPTDSGTADTHGAGLDRRPRGWQSLARPARFAVGYTLAGALAFAIYLRLSDTYPENSDMANILLMGWDLLHGNLLLHGWHTSDVSFYSTELVQYALLESFLGLHMATAHVAAAMTYTLVVLLAVALARGGASGREAVLRTLIAAGILVAPQLSTGVYALDVAVGHIGTSVPLLMIWLLLDRAGRRWWVPVLTAGLLAWALVADPIVLVMGIAPLCLVAGARFLGQYTRHRRDTYDAALVAAGVIAYGLAWAVERVLHALGGYTVNPLPLQGGSLSVAVPALWRVLALFGADASGTSGLMLLLAVVHLASAALAVVALGRVFLTRSSRRGVPLVDQALAVGIIANVTLYLGTMVATQGAHEVAIAAPYTAALAGRLLARPALAMTSRSRAVGAATGALVLACYLAGLGYELTIPACPPSDSVVASWLANHHLRSGLAGYWNSSSVTVDSGGRVTVRAVMLGSLAPSTWMSKATWYDPATHHADFLLLAKPTKPQLDHARGRFGPVARTYRVAGFTILVWDHNLLATTARR